MRVGIHTKRRAHWAAPMATSQQNPINKNCRKQFLDQCKILVNIELHSAPLMSNFAVLCTKTKSIETKNCKQLILTVERLAYHAPYNSGHVEGICAWNSLHITHWCSDIVHTKNLQCISTILRGFRCPYTTSLPSTDAAYIEQPGQTNSRR